MSDVTVTYGPAPPEGNWTRFGRLPTPAFLWTRLTSRRDEALLGLQAASFAESRELCSQGWISIEQDLNRGSDGVSVFLVLNRIEGSPILDIKVIEDGEALGQGFIKDPVQLVSGQKLFLCVKTQQSLDEEMNVGFEIKAGDQLDIKDQVGKWCVAKVLDVDLSNRKIYVHYEGWGDKWNEWIIMDPSRLAKYKTYTEGYTGPKGQSSGFALDDATISRIKDMNSQLLELTRKGTGLDAVPTPRSDIFLGDIMNLTSGLLNATYPCAI